MKKFTQNSNPKTSFLANLFDFEVILMLFCYIIPIFAEIFLFTFYKKDSFLNILYGFLLIFAFIIYFANAPLFEETLNFAIGCINLTIGILLFYQFSIGFFIACELWVFILTIVILSSPLFSQYNFFTFTGLLSMIAAISTGIVLLFPNEFLLINVDTSFNKIQENNEPRCFIENIKNNGFLQELLEFSKIEPIIFLSGNKGIGKTTLLQKISKENSGIFYYELSQFEKLDNIANKLFRGNKSYIISYISLYLYINREYKFDDIEMFISQNKAYFTNKYNRKPIFIFDNFDLFLQNENMQKLLDFARKGANSGSFVTIFVTDGKIPMKIKENFEFTEIKTELKFTKNDLVKYIICSMPYEFIEKNNIVDELYEYFDGNIENYVRYVKLRTLNMKTINESISIIMEKYINTQIKKNVMNDEKKAICFCNDFIRNLIFGQPISLEKTNKIYTDCLDFYNENSLFKISKNETNFLDFKFKTEFHRKLISEIYQNLCK